MKFENRKSIQTKIGKIYIDLLESNDDKSFYKQSSIIKKLKEENKRLLTSIEIKEIRENLLKIEDLCWYADTGNIKYKNQRPIVMCDLTNIAFIYINDVNIESGLHYKDLKFKVIYKDL